MSRHELRENVFRIIFSLEHHAGEDPGDVADKYLDETLDLEISDEDRFFIRNKVITIAGRLEELDREIDSITEGWKTNRMGRTELNILRLAFYEIRYDEQVPMKVAINEAVELSKEYCSDDTPAFVNGILARLVREQE